ncbi:visual pigment-like receptor peropsin [Brachyhypopomus gauderio]|uniref:visual pigment-like receptor peropsin n=1 Tax=Brachyhypopomus gauderio TaxID=698409 RepID=UPI00404115CD
MLVLHSQRFILQASDLLTLNLAVTDAAMAVFGYSRGIVKIFNVFSDGGYVITWIWNCQVNGFLTLLFGLSTVNTLTVISVTRYLKGRHSKKAYIMSRSTIFISIVCIWMGALFWSMAPLLGWGSYTDSGYGTCEVDWSKSHCSMYQSFVISILTSCFIVPVLVILFTYISTINTVKSCNTMSVNGCFSERQRRVERELTRVSMAISTAFILAWSPYAIMCMCLSWGLHVPRTVHLFACLWAKSACLYNPFIYLAVSSRFRGGVAALVPGSCRTHNSIRLLRFTSFTPRAELMSVALVSPPQGEVNQCKLGLLPEDKDSGFNTLPQLSKGHFDILLPKAADLTEYECDRL